MEEYKPQTKVLYNIYRTEAKTYAFINGFSRLSEDLKDRLTACEAEFNRLIAQGNQFLKEKSINHPVISFESTYFERELDIYTDILISTVSGKDAAIEILQTYAQRKALLDCIKRHGHDFNRFVRGSKKSMAMDCTSCFVCGQGKGIKETKNKEFGRCPHCHVKTYCSQKCFDKHWKDGHKEQCPRFAVPYGIELIDKDEEIDDLATAIGGYSNFILLTDEEFLKFGEYFETFINMSKK